MQWLLKFKRIAQKVPFLMEPIESFAEFKGLVVKGMEQAEGPDLVISLS